MSVTRRGALLLGVAVAGAVCASSVFAEVDPTLGVDRKIGKASTVQQAVWDGLVEQLAQGDCALNALASKAAITMPHGGLMNKQEFEEYCKEYLANLAPQGARTSTDRILPFSKRSFLAETTIEASTVDPRGSPLTVTYPAAFVVTLTSEKKDAQIGALKLYAQNTPLLEANGLSVSPDGALESLLAESGIGGGKGAAATAGGAGGEGTEDLFGSLSKAAAALGGGGLVAALGAMGGGDGEGGGEGLGKGLASAASALTSAATHLQSAAAGEGTDGLGKSLSAAYAALGGLASGGGFEGISSILSNVMEGGSLQDAAKAALSGMGGGGGAGAGEGGERGEGGAAGGGGGGGFEGLSSALGDLMEGGSLQDAAKAAMDSGLDLGKLSEAATTAFGNVDMEKLGEAASALGGAFGAANKEGQGGRATAA